MTSFKNRAVLLFFFFAALPSRPEDRAFRRVSAALHLHSNVSPRGSTPLPSMAALAGKKGLDVLIPTDHFLSRWEYGVPPFPGLFRMTRHERDVTRFGLERYLRDVRRLSSTHPGVLALPGVETRPAYRWSGHPAKQNLTLHDSQRHMLIFGLGQEELRGLPVQSNGAAGRVKWSRLAGPFLLAGLGLFLMVRWPAGLLVVVLGALWGIDQRPFRRVAAAEGYARDGYAAAQGVIDHVTARGGIVVWAHPEATNWKEPQKVFRGVYMETQPYPEAVLATDGATGFGYYWEGHRTVGAVGGLWDQALRAWLEGKRRAPLWAFGELDWNQEDRLGVSMDRIQNVLWVGEKTEPEVLEAFRRGRFYVLEKTGEPAIVVEGWTAAARGRRAVSGESLSWAPQARLTLLLSGRGAARVEVIRNGAQWRQASGNLPLRWEEPLPPPEGGGDFYRFVVKGGGVAVGNPIFITKEK
jgi:hypothetical protein